MMPDSFWLEEAEGAPPVAYVVDLGANPEVRLDGRGAAEESRTAALTADMEFTAPETIKYNMYDPRTDVYLLGLIAWFMLTGAPPFQGKNHYQVASMQLQQTVPGLRTVVPGISEEVEALIGRMLEKEPDARVQTMGEVGRELAAVREAGAKGRGGAEGASARAGVVAPAGLGVRASVMVRAPAMVESEVPTIPRTPVGTSMQPVEPTEILHARDEGRAHEVSETMVLREPEEAALDIERTTAFVTRSVVSAREASVAQAPVEDQTANEHTRVQRVQPVYPTVDPPEGTQVLTSLVQSGLTEVVRRSDLGPSAASSVPATAWTPEPLAPASWSAPEQFRHPGPDVPGPSSPSTIHGWGAREPMRVVTLPVAWIVLAFVATILGGLALGVWLAG
jgi:hypothetical protein